jgi:hypothetical protein
MSDTLPTTIEFVTNPENLFDTTTIRIITETLDEIRRIEKK